MLSGLLLETVLPCQSLCTWTSGYVAHGPVGSHLPSEARLRINTNIRASRKRSLVSEDTAPPED
jgi:hypothetical protein